MSGEGAGVMTEENKSALVPRRRFPEFRGAGDWVEMSLGEIGEIITGKTPSTSDDSLWNGDIQFVTPTDISEEKYQWSTQRSVAINANAKVLPLHSTMFTCIASIGKMALSVKPCITNQQINTVIPNKDYENEFVYYSLLNIVPLIKGTQANSTLPIINKTEFSKFTIPVPRVHDEQQKIADCLSSLDELITAETQKLDALKTHKKGLMQQLFPREGETEPVRRFSTEGDWTVASLPDVVFLQEGPGIMAVDFCGEGVPLVRLAGVAGPTVTLDGCNYLDPEKVAQKWAHFRLELDDLIISTSATFGLSSIVTEVASGAVFYTGLIRFRPSNERLNLGYLKIFLSSPCFARQAESAAVGGGIKHFGPTHLKQMEIPFPPLAEQQRISGCLASLDDLISAQSQKVDALKTHKKGLMQQLFPVLDEVSA